jgi:nucleoside 2-deoxyribosyltransferase
VYDPVSNEVQCKIQTVADIPHNERIDDRIMKEICEAAVIVVDLTNHNFNVAFEAGYALALNKPIIWTMKKDDTEKLNLPFDIQSHNILVYDKNEIVKFKEILKARMQVALNVLSSSIK